MLFRSQWIHSRNVERLESNSRVVGDWELHRGGLQRLGAVPGSIGPNQGGPVWISGTNGEAFLSSPAVLGDSVFVTGFRGNKGRISCFDAKTGNLRWSSAPRGYQATFSSPVIADARLVCGEGLHATRTGRVVCVDLRPGRVGEIAWTFATNSHVECTPVLDAGKVYVGAGDDGIYCLDLAHGGQIWHAKGSAYPDAETSLVVFEGRVDRKSTRLNSSHSQQSRMPSSA